MIHKNDLDDQHEFLSSQNYIIRFAEGIVRDFLLDLGLYRDEIAPSTIIFSSQSRISQYRQESNTIILGSSDEISLQVLIHELIHFFSASQQLFSGKALEEHTNLRHVHIEKSGFHSVWTSHETGNRTSFLGALNEAITEQITSDIFSCFREKMKHEIPTLQRMFEGKKVVQLQRIEHEKEVAIALKLKEYKEYYIHAVKELISSWKKYQVWVDGVLECEQDVSLKNALALEREQALVALKSSITQYRHMLKTLSRSYSSVTKSQFKDEMEAVHRSFTFAYNPEITYFEEITMLNYLLDGLAYHEMTHLPGKSFVDVRNVVKKDLYRAYFKGNSFFLRKIDKTFGNGMLRKINAIPTIRVSTEVQQCFEQVLEEIQNTVQALSKKV